VNGTTRAGYASRLVCLYQEQLNPLRDSQKMPMARTDRYALTLLVSLLFFLLACPFVTEDRKGEIIFVLALYWTFVAATMMLSEQKSLQWTALMLAVCSLSFTLITTYHPVRTLLIAQWTLMAAFFGSVSAALFMQLGRPGKVTSGRLYISVSVYLLLGIFYFALFNLLDSIHPESFVQTGLPAETGITRYSHLYFSLATLTTLGYGDIVPATRPAQMLAVLEAATGVLYIAITVARLVAAYQGATSDRD
jgi:Ion channel